ncbi:MAG: hypothetical protein H6742_04145 [Alphaproteobacteria bacterium]|nr:hypothetical protein [Alphaproteobacteria bacterium]
MLLVVSLGAAPGCPGLPDDDPCAAQVPEVDRLLRQGRKTWTLRCGGQPLGSGSLAFGPARFELQSPVIKTPVIKAPVIKTPVIRTTADTPPVEWRHCAPRIGVACDAGDRSVRADLSTLRGDAPLAGGYQRLCAVDGPGVVVLYLPGGPSGTLRCAVAPTDPDAAACEDAAPGGGPVDCSLQLTADPG